MRLRVDDAKTTVAARCRWDDGATLSVGAAASSRIEEKAEDDLSCFPLDPGGAKSRCGSLDLLESKSERAQSGDRWCSIDLHPEAYGWTMSGLRLRFSLNGERIDLVKVSD